MGKSKIEFIPFRPDHLGLMDLRDWDRKFLSHSPEMSAASADIFYRNGAAYTGISSDGIVGAGGVTRVLPGNYELWVYTTPLFPRYALSIHRFALRYIESFFSSPYVRRIQCVVDSEYTPAWQWAMKLGFDNEGILKKYGPDGQDFFMCAKVK